ncbi:peptidase MA family metallohydrolase [Chloroflexota bacterium]
MIKKMILVGVLLMALALPGSVLAQADSGIRVQDSSVLVNFPASISFQITARSGVSINDIRLHYQVDRMAVAQVTSEIYLEFTPGTQVRVTWDWDMRKTGGMPPGSQVKYWWTVTDASGSRIETQPELLNFEDERYQWHQLTEGKITLYWYQGDDDFAGELMAATQETLARVAAYAGATPEKPIKLYIYGNSEDLRGSMIFPQEWTGGVAFTQHSTVAIGIAPGNLEWGKRAIAHELTHLVIHQIIFSAYGNLPTWLDEGLAMNGEGKLEDFFVASLNQAIVNDALLSVRSIASPFSAYAEESALAYAESYSIVKFLVDNYGKEKMFTLLKTYQEGSSYDNAFIEVYDFDMDGLNDLWQTYLKNLAT